MHSNKNNNELKKYTQGLRKFKFTIPRNVKKIINKKGNLFYDILEKWDYLVEIKTKQSVINVIWNYLLLSGWRDINKKHIAVIYLNLK